MPSTALSQTDRPKSREQAKAETRQRIVNAAGKLLLEEGFKAFTMRRVAKAANIAQPSFYTHFDSMDTLLEELVGITREQFIAPQANAMMSLSQNMDFETLETVIQNFIRLAFETAFAYPTLFCMTISQRALQDSSYGRIIQNEFENVRQLYIQFVTKFAKQHGISVELETVEMGVDAILGSNEALISACIDGRYKNKEAAMDMASDIIIRQILASVEAN